MTIHDLPTDVRRTARQLLVTYALLTAFLSLTGLTALAL